jgi:WD40 repeat protein
MLNDTNIVAYIKKDNAFEKKEEKKVHLYNESEEKIIGLFEFTDIVRHVLLNMSSVVISITNTVYIYSLMKLDLQHKIDVYPLSGGLCCITPVIQKKFYLSTVGEITGTIQLWVFQIEDDNTITNIEKPNLNLTSSLEDSTNTQIILKQNTICAHQTAIRTMTFSQNGKYIATCSERGTLIRIYNTSTRQIVKELRRGTNGAVISWLSFSHDNAYLLCRNKSGTIHIFHTDYDKYRKHNNTQLTVTGYLKSYLNFGPFKQYMPTYIDSEWSFVQFNLGISTIAAFNNIKTKTIIVISFKGDIYTIDYNNIDRVSVIKQSI